MKKIMILLLLTGSMVTGKVQAQSIADDLQQLALDYQKLAGLKSTLQEMYKGYELVNNGYNSVKNVSKGNFDLHNAFLTGLLLVSPAVRKYPRVADIISDQSALVKEYKSAYSAFKQDKHFNPDEISYMGDVYNNLVNNSIQHLDQLSLVMADNKLRMSDNERIQLIDHIYTGGHDQLTYLRRFNDHTRTVAIERANQTNDNSTLKTLYGIQ